MRPNPAAPARDTNTEQNPVEGCIVPLEGSGRPFGRPLSASGREPGPTTDRAGSEEGARIMESRRGAKSLSRMVAEEAALVIGGAMAVYAVFEYLFSPDRTVWGLVLEHGWHIAVLGLLSYGVLYLILVKKVVEPIRDLYVKFYAIAGGDFRPITMDTGIHEIQEIVDGVNLMLSKMQGSGDSAPWSELSAHARQLREVAKKADSADRATRETLMEIARRIDEAVTGLTAERLSTGGG